MLKTPADLKSSGSRSTPLKGCLMILDGTKNEINIVSLQKNMTLGRPSPKNVPDIPINSPIVSRKQGRFTVTAEGFFYSDTESLNGTYINGVLFEGNETPVELNDGDIIKIDRKNSVYPHKDSVVMVFSTSFDTRSKWRKQRFVVGTAVQFGRNGAGMPETNPAKMAVRCAGFSFNKTDGLFENFYGARDIFLNNLPAERKSTIRLNDVVKIGRDYIFCCKNELLYSVCLATDSGLIVDIKETNVAEGLTKKTLLKDIYAQVDRGDFTLIIGGSGAGKSTLINSILGKYKMNGTIMLGGQRVTAGSAIASRIAYVPQTLPLRKEERLIDVVRDTAILRMNGKMTNKEREQFIMETLDSLGLKSKAKMEIKKLSGGEQRRAAIANEVVTNSDIFFLDEPDSGLDPKSGMELMNNLRVLSEKGKIVMLISHNYASYPNPERIYTKVIILAKSNADGIGRLAFMGSVKDALEFFNVESLKDITKLINPISENGDGRADEFVEKYRRMTGR